MDLDLSSRHEQSNINTTTLRGEKLQEAYLHDLDARRINRKLKHQLCSYRRHSSPTVYNIKLRMIKQVQKVNKQCI